ncbi:hypothetical protein, partial [Pseudoalteromonas tetraodonis]|uniref:hypothetical protein n=1 Tax=Pseudoalteromonas tetraodonis TaxID=43659 RepID=UPI003734F802
RYKIAATKNYHHVAAGLPRVFVFNDLGLTRYKIAATKSYHHVAAGLPCVFVFNDLGLSKI